MKFLPDYEYCHLKKRLLPLLLVALISTGSLPVTAGNSDRCKAIEKIACHHVAWFGEFPLNPRNLTFHQNGSVREGQLGKDAAFGDIVLFERTQLKFRNDGILESAVPRYHQPIADLRVLRGSTLEFYGNGNLKRIETAFKTGGWYRDRYYPGGTVLEFSEDGSVASDTFYPAVVRITHARERVNAPVALLEIPWPLEHFILPVGSLVYGTPGFDLKQVIVPENWNHNGLEFSRGTVKFDSNGKILFATPSRDQQRDGIVYMGNEQPMRFYESGQIASAQLAHDQTIKNIVLSAPMRNSRYDHFDYPEQLVNFYPDQRLERGILSKDLDQTIQGYPLLKWSKIRLHNNGRLAEAVLSGDFQVGVWPLKKGSPITFDRDGMMSSGTTATEVTIQDIRIPQSSRVEWFSNGIIKSIQAADNVTVQGIIISQHRSIRDKIEFYATGQLRKGRIFEDVELGGIQLTRGSVVTFDRTGQVSRFTPPDRRWLAESEVRNAAPVVFSGREQPPSVELQKIPCDKLEGGAKNAYSSIGFSLRAMKCQH